MCNLKIVVIVVVEIKAQINELKVKLSGLETSVNTVKDASVATSNQLVAVSDKASTAKGCLLYTSDAADE